ncbi:MAG: MliC family protein [Alphaproteobacteria bacterium]|nr:MliC family protein [Alphaproteobacteria bacterium]
MKKAMMLASVIGMCAACDGTKTNTQYLCGNYDLEMSMSDDGNVMNAVVSGDAVDLVLSPSASGAKYVGMWNSTNIILWGKGNLWTMFLGPDETMIECSIK